LARNQRPSGSPQNSPSFIQWEALAPYPDHARDALHDSGSATQNPVHHPQSSFAPPKLHEVPVDDAPAFSETHRPLPSSDHFSYAPQRAPRAAPSPSNAPGCPHCGSTRIDTLNIGRRAGSTLGSAAGATSGVAMALFGAEAGAAVGAVGGPVGAVFGGLAGAVIAGLLGGAAGSAAGSAVGSVLDDNVFDNYRCLTCGHTFGSTFH